MSTYKQIHGTDIEVLSSDPANPVDGQVWYNSTSNTVKANFINLGSWATGGSLNQARYALAGAGADNTTALGFGGFGPGAPATGLTESYDGTSWTEVNDLNAARDTLIGAGTQTSALAIGGENATAISAETESWNGTSWTEVNDLNTAIEFFGTAGIQTAALAFGGRTPITTATEEWNAGPETKTITSS